MRGGATRWKGSAECQGNFAGYVKTILPTSRAHGRHESSPGACGKVDQPVLAHAISDPEASGPQNRLDSLGMKA
jgi:hypothetical protein